MVGIILMIMQVATGNTKEKWLICRKYLWVVTQMKFEEIWIKYSN